MKVLWQAIRAATIETLGVALVVVVLFGVPTWSLRGTGPDVPGSDVVRGWLQSMRDGVQAGISALQPTGTARRHYVEERLDFYSQTYRQASTDYAKHVVHDAISGPRG